mmetsp:Transcript_89100/g.235669  ORF Transcript_89100/g.235669 Transcript_89100/m.235669 type:complete len:255 (+) Transcript_89100:799-1563(+)
MQTFIREYLAFLSFPQAPKLWIETHWLARWREASGPQFRHSCFMRSRTAGSLAPSVFDPNNMTASFCPTPARSRAPAREPRSLQSTTSSSPRPSAVCSPMAESFPRAWARSSPARVFSLQSGSPSRMPRSRGGADEPVTRPNGPLRSSAWMIFVPDGGLTFVPRPNTPVGAGSFPKNTLPGLPSDTSPKGWSHPNLACRRSSSPRMRLRRWSGVDICLTWGLLMGKGSHCSQPGMLRSRSWFLSDTPGLRSEAR